MRIALTLCALVLGACSVSDLHVRLHLDGVDAGAVARLRTTISPIAPRRFDTDVALATLRTGEHYRVACLDCPSDGCAADCARTLVFEEDAQLGFVMTNPIELRFRNESGGSVGELEVRALAFSAGADPIASSDRIDIDYRETVTVDLFVRPPGRCGQVTCAIDEQCCDLACVPLNDPTHCVSCGKSCGAAEVCSEGACACAGGPACATGQTCCPGAGCVDLTNDPKHCQTCDGVCAKGEQCQNGACSCEGGPACTGD